jgi:hypothetical protein
MERTRYRNQLIFQVSIIGSLIIGLAGLTWANHRFVENDPGLNDFTPRWAATRWFMTKGQSPYSQQTVEDVQKLIFGNLSNSDNFEFYYIYPFFSTLLYSPFALIEDPTMARALWMTCLEIAMLGISGLGIFVLRWNPPKWIFAVVLLFPLIWYYSVRSVLNGNIVVLCTLFISIAFLSIRANHDSIAGFLLALALLLYQVYGLLFIFILIWAASNKRWSLFWSQWISLAFLLVAPTIFIPNWILPFLGEVINHASFGFTPQNVLTNWLPGVGKQLSWILSGFTIGLLVWEWKSAFGKDFRSFLWTACFTMVITDLIGLPVSIENFVILLPVLILVLAIWDERWGSLGRWLIGVSLFFLVFGIWAATIHVARLSINPDQDVILVFLPPLFSTIGLYWVRRWAIRPQLLFSDNLANDTLG